jgi:hypothetical protein
LQVRRQDLWQVGKLNAFDLKDNAITNFSFVSPCISLEAYFLICISAFPKNSITSLKSKNKSIQFKFEDNVTT